MTAAAATLPQRVTVQCARCDVTEVALDALLPRTWELLDGRPHCDDCIRAIFAVSPPADAITRTTRLHSIGPAGETSQFRGCRLGLDVARGSVTLRIHAGINPPADARDEPIQFMLSGQEFDQLIARLQVIQLERLTSERKDD